MQFDKRCGTIQLYSNTKMKVVHDRLSMMILVSYNKNLQRLASPRIIIIQRCARTRDICCI